MSKYNNILVKGQRDRNRIKEVAQMHEALIDNDEIQAKLKNKKSLIVLKEIRAIIECISRLLIMILFVGVILLIIASIIAPDIRIYLLNNIRSIIGMSPV